MQDYVFVAQLTPEEGGYAVEFPDVPGCFTCGDSLAHALEMAEDALSLWLVSLEDAGEAIPPAATTLREAQAATEGMATLIVADPMGYRKRMRNQAVKKTLTIPQWMNEAAEKQGINFSQTLQEALKEKLQMA